MHTPMTIAGRARDGGGEALPVRDPALGTVFATAPGCSPAQLDEAVAAAAAAHRQWAAAAEDERRQALLACGDALRGQVDELAELLTAEQGKPLRDARAELALAASWFGHTAALSVREHRVVDEPATEVSLTRIPVGTVAAIAPSNYPVILAVTKLAPALLAGNTVVLKPSPLTPLTTLRIGQLLDAVLPAGVVNTVCGDDWLGPALTGHPGIDMISFTGSVATGEAIATAAATRLRRVVLELGGNDAAVVLAGADIATIAPRLFEQSTVNSGQFCAAIKRIYVWRGQAGELVEALRGAAQAARVGDGRSPCTDLGPLVSAQSRDRVAGLVDAARHHGARVVAGGSPLPGTGYFYPPTVVTDLPPGTALEQEEQFGPVIPVIAYDHLDGAVARANGTRYGLGGSVWGDPEVALATAAQLECGTVWVNTHGELRHDVPFGGLRSSGIGVEYGYLGLLEYTRLRVLNVARKR